jgi:hypothetical protein
VFLCLLSFAQAKKVRRRQGTQPLKNALKASVTQRREESQKQKNYSQRGMVIKESRHLQQTILFIPVKCYSTERGHVANTCPRNLSIMFGSG